MSVIAKLLIIDDDVSAIRALSKVLVDVGEIHFATSGNEGLQLARRHIPDLILLDAEMPGMSGFEMCRLLKADPLLQATPVIFITSHTESTMEEEGLRLGAVDFIGKPIRPAIVAARVKTHLNLKLAWDQLQHLARTDGLTGLTNRRVLNESLENIWHGALRNQRAVSLLMLDVDNFKKYNDQYGHLAGDECLIKVANCLRESVNRSVDVVARYGGEEFALLLPETDAEGATLVADKILDTIRSGAIAHSQTEYGVVTVSIGIACLDQDSSIWANVTATNRSGMAGLMNPEQFLSVADKALYAAKREGRNCFRLEYISA